MICETCGTHMMIAHGGTAVEGDASANEVTRVYAVLSYTCRNSKCSMCGKPGPEVRHLIYPEEGAEV